MDFFLLGKNPENLISGLFLVGFLFEKSPWHDREYSYNIMAFGDRLPLI
jgi:hypothetical protein